MICDFIACSNSRWSTHLERDYPNARFDLIRLERQLPNEYRVFVDRWRIDDPRLSNPCQKQSSFRAQAMMKQWTAEWNNACSKWDQFWFSPQSQDTLAFLRICTGAMLAYIHLIWLIDLDSYMGPHAWVDRATMLQLKGGSSAWTYLWYIDSLPFLYAHELLAIAAGLAMAVGFLTRITLPLVWFLTLMVCHRMTGMLFGLDQVVMMISMYLILAPAGARWSLDARLRDRRGRASWLFPSSQPDSMTCFATRMLQIHLCIVYLFGGLSKLRGEMWQDGSALWFAAASYEYQSLDLTWLGHFPTSPRS